MFCGTNICATFYRRLSFLHNTDMDLNNVMPVPEKDVFGHIQSVKIRVILNPTGWLHVNIFRLCFYLLEVYSIDSSTMIGNPTEISNSNRSFLQLNRFICNSPPVLPGHSQDKYAVRFRKKKKSQKDPSKCMFQIFKLLKWALGMV